MTGDHYDDLPPRARRRLLVRTVARPVLTMTGLLILYFVLPLGDRDTMPSPVVFFLELLLVAVLLGLQMRQISTADYPRLRAIEALSLSVPLFILVFAAVYYETARDSPSTFSEAMSRTDSLYFTVTTFASVGFGDITPVSQTARIVVMIQMIGDLILLGFVAHAIVGAVQVGIRRKQPDSQSDS